ncbi:MAG TPA: 50S ribosomal protein L32 [Candidatus Kapabacteria bacterium]|nr:50S ribosomal protein L32 [Candidatus Kapabacteria bacterium]
MPNPTHRNSRTRRDKRRTHYKLEHPQFGSCPNCGSPKLAHTACASCGFYNGRSVLQPKDQA